MSVFVIRRSVCYSQPWVGRGAEFVRNRSLALRFEREFDAWSYLIANSRRLGTRCRVVRLVPKGHLRPKCMEVVAHCPHCKDCQATCARMRGGK